MDDLAGLLNRVQLTTDGHRAYLVAVEGAFGYAMLIKMYESSQEEARYSLAKCVDSRKKLF